MKDYTFKPYKACFGKKYIKYKNLRKWHKPVTNTRYTKLCNTLFTEKNKIRFLKQFLRWFIKDSWGYKISLEFKVPYTTKSEKLIMSEGDVVNVACLTRKAAWKKILSRTNFEYIDYAYLRTHKYILYYRFYFWNLTEKSKEITLDIHCSGHNIYYVHITLNGFYLKDFETIIENGKII